MEPAGNVHAAAFVGILRRDLGQLAPGGAARPFGLGLRLPVGVRPGSVGGDAERRAGGSTVAVLHVRILPKPPNELHRIKVLHGHFLRRNTNLRSYLYHSLPTVGARIPDNVLLRNANWYKPLKKGKHVCFPQEKSEEIGGWYDVTRPLVEGWRQYTTTIPGVEGPFTDYHDVTG
ncbi:MAG TPA: hypothetical protein VEZ12_10685 [Herpetosiphonaceae bacterium]|nr:hypothetical protein [Herpetosiphonaceae bacterium]